MMRLKTLMRAAIFVAATAFISGCASKEEMAASDDAECKSWGAKPGTEAYLRCRAYMSERRMAAAKAVGAGVARGMQAQADAYKSYRPPTTTTCRPNYAGGMTCSTY